MTIRKANVAAQKPERWRRRSATAAVDASTAGAGPPAVAHTGSPDPHAAIDHEVDAGHVGTLTGREEQRDVGHVLRLTEPAQQGPVAHRAAPLLVLQLSSGRTAFDQARRDRVDLVLAGGGPSHAPAGAGHNADLSRQPAGHLSCMSFSPAATATMAIA